MVAVSNHKNIQFSYYFSSLRLSCVPLILFSYWHVYLKGKLRQQVLMPERLSSTTFLCYERKEAVYLAIASIKSCRHFHWKKVQTVDIGEYLRAHTNLKSSSITWNNWSRLSNFLFARTAQWTTSNGKKRKVLSLSATSIPFDHCLRQRDFNRMCPFIAFFRVPCDPFLCKSLFPKSSFLFLSISVLSSVVNIMTRSESYNH